MPWNRFTSSSKIFLLTVLGQYFFCGSFMFFCLVFVCLCVCLFICALWSPAGKGLTSWLSFVVSNCEFVTFPLVFWVRCGTSLYRFLIFESLLTFFHVCLFFLYVFHFILPLEIQISWLLTKPSDQDSYCFPLWLKLHAYNLNEAALQVKNWGGVYYAKNIQHYKY